MNSLLADLEALQVGRISNFGRSMSLPNIKLGVHKPSFWDQVEYELKTLDEHDQREPLSEDGLAIPTHLCWRDTQHTCDGTNTSKKKRKYFRCQHAKCRTCVDLDYSLYANTDENNLTTSLYEIPRYRTISTSIYAMNASAKRGCQLCMVIFDGIKSFFRKRPVREDFASSWHNGGLGIILQREGSVKIHHLRTEIQFYSQDDLPPPFTVFTKGATLPLRPSPEYCITFAKRNLEFCQTRHADCRPVSAQILPKRVLDLGEGASPIINLMETSGDVHTSYVALSHCWGPPDSVPKTTRQNFDSHVQGIQFSDLPATFQDVITVTRGLGMRYLWIDSLCIIQGDRLDWETESSKMADVYSRCTLCIAVDGSTDARGGCFFDRYARDFDTKTSMKPLELTIPDGTVQAKIFAQLLPQSAHELLYYGRSYIAMETIARQAPLQQRAWSLQERILSPRILHFHNEELAWECKTGSACECGSLALDRAISNGWEEQMQRSLKNLSAETIRKGEIVIKSDRHYSVFEMWKKIVGDLSHMLITQETDRLPALAGIASLFAPSIGGKYLAGLWEAELAKSLTWQRSKDSSPALSVRITEPSSIPSWSWASIKSNNNRYSTPIEFMAYDLEPDEHFKVLEASCLVSEASPFGSVFGGKICVRALSKHAQLLHQHQHQHQGIPDGKYDHVICFSDHDDKEPFLPDVSCVDGVPSYYEDVLLLMLGSVHAVTGGGKRDPGMRDLAIVLRKVGERKWERIGRVTFWDNVHHFKKSAVETFTLV